MTQQELHQLWHDLRRYHDEHCQKGMERNYAVTVRNVVGLIDATCNRQTRLTS